MEKNNLVPQNDQPLSVPGIGVGGTVMCDTFKCPCFKNGCEKWVELDYAGKKVAHCTEVWKTIIAVEQRQAMDRINETLREVLALSKGPEKEVPK